MSIIDTIRSEGFLSSVSAKIPDDLEAAKFVSVLNSYLRQNRSLIEADQNALISSIMEAASDGLLLDSREAFISKYGSRVKYIPMILGMRKVLMRSAKAHLETGIIYENDEFDYALGDHAYILHKPAKLGTPRGAFVGAWAIITSYLTNPPHSYHEVMDKEEIGKIQAMSPAKNGPWVTYPDMMRRKTVGRRAARQIPNIPVSFIERESSIDIPDEPKRDFVPILERVKNV